MTQESIDLAKALGEEISPTQVTPTPTPKEEAPPKVEDEEHLDEGKSDINLGELKLEDLLKHPKLSTELKSWADKEAANQLRGKTDSIRSQLKPEVRAEVERQVADETLRKYFAGLNEEALGEVLASNKELAGEYGRLAQEERQQQSQPDMMAAMVHGYAIQMAQWDRLLQASGLEDAKKAELAPENYVDKGEAGLVEWGQAIQEAIIAHEVEKSLNSVLEERWQAYLQEQQAEQDANRVGRPVMAKGTRTGPLPDLMENTSSDLLTEALSRTNGRK